MNGDSVPSNALASGVVAPNNAAARSAVNGALRRADMGAKVLVLRAARCGWRRYEWS
jgi:hypothetical protein